MALTAEDIQNVSFSIARKGGYDVDEVDVFLEHVADEVGAMNQQIEDLEHELAKAVAAKNQPAAFGQVAEEAAAEPVIDNSAQVAELEAQVADLEAQLAEKQANDNAIAQALIVAQRSADEVLSNARAEASGIIKDADEEADRIIGKAESDRLKIAEAIKTLETDRADVRAEYREMLSSFMADAQKKLADIDGDSRRAAVTAKARNEANAAAYAPNGGVPITSGSSATVAPSAPAAPAVATSAAPAASGYIDKDFSGYGAADADFEFDDID